MRRRTLVALRTTGAWPLSLGVNGGDNLYISGATGNVGIGSSTPSALLSIASRFKFNSDGTMNWGSTANHGLLSWDTGKAIINSTGGNDLSIGATTDQLYLNSSGAVGIGTTDPQVKLDVAGSARADLFLVRSNQAAPTADAFIFRPADNSLGLGTANTERIRINSSGNVGIGTTNPGAKLQVDSGSVGLVALINSTDANGSYISLATSGTTYADIGTAKQAISGSLSASDLGITARGNNSVVLGTNGGERLRINGSATSASARQPRGARSPSPAPSASTASQVQPARGRSVSIPTSRSSTTAPPTAASPRPAPPSTTSRPFRSMIWMW